MATKKTTTKKTTAAPKAKATKVAAPRAAAKPKAAADALNAKVLNREGKEAGSVSLPAHIFGLPWNADFIHQVVTALRSNARAGTADTRMRGEVRGGGKKPWKQKGTGRARHGSNRSPIWAGGGVAHGPRIEKSYARKVNRTARVKALGVALSKKLADGEIFFIDTLALTAPKAKDAKAMLTALSAVAPAIATKRTNAALVAIPGRDEAAELSFRNFGNVSVMQVRDLNPVDLLTYKYIVFASPEASVEVLDKRFAARTKSARA